MSQDAADYHHSLHNAPAPLANMEGFIRCPMVRGIPLERIAIDPLHVLLRIGDRLFELLICDHVLGKAENLKRKFKIELKRIGIPFNFFVGADKGKGAEDWDTLNGDQYAKVFGPDGVKLANIFDVDVAQPIQQLWDGFFYIYYALNTATISEERVTQTWVRHYMRDDLYGNKTMTPYIHLLTTHWTDIIRRVGGASNFSCQALEKLNHVNKRAVFTQTNVGGGRKGLLPGHQNYSLTHQLMNYHMPQRYLGDFVNQGDQMTPVEHPCPFCPRNFKRFGNYKNHLKLVHFPGEEEAEFHMPDSGDEGEN